MLRMKYVAVTILLLCLWVGYLQAQTGATKPSEGLQAPQKGFVESLYASDAYAWSHHDIAKIVSFFDPTCVIYTPGGTRTSYAEWRKNLAASFAPARHSQVRITVNAVQGVENGFVASIELRHSYESYDTKRSAWIPMISVFPQENTWRSDGHGNFRIVLVKLSPSRTTAVVAQSGSYLLTEEMMQQALRFGQILAGADFSPSDAAALKGDLIAYFEKEPATQIAAYEGIAKTLPRPSIVTGRNTWLDLALFRYNVWHEYAGNPKAFRDFQSYPFGKMVIKYNPVLVNSGGMIVTQTDVACQFYSNALVAQGAGVPLPTQTEREQFIRALPSRFASLPREQQEYLTRAEVRLWGLYTVYVDTVKTRALVAADIKKNVHTTADVWREARQVENDAEYNAKYYQMYRSEAWGAVLNANRVVLLQQALQSFDDRISGIMRQR